MSFASEPGRDDSNLPPVNIVIPDDARELDRDVLAYRREQRARRRRQRVTRVFGPFGRREFGGHAAILPLIATCVALSMLAGAMLSVITISPASAPTVPPSAVATAPPSHASTAPSTASPATRRIALPAGNVRLDDKTVPIHSLARSALALVPASCHCALALRRLAGQAAMAHVRVYFVGADPAMPQVTSLATTDGAGVAKPVYDKSNVFGATYHPVGLTVLLVHGDYTAEVHRNLPANFQLGPDLRQLALPGSQAAATAADLPKAEPSPQRPRRLPVPFLRLVVDWQAFGTAGVCPASRHAMEEAFAVIRSRSGKTVARSLLIGALALMISAATAGCEAGLDAPTLQFHPAASGANVVVNGIKITNAFVLGAPTGSSIPAGSDAGMFLSVFNGGSSSDALVSVDAPGYASSVQLSSGTVSLPVNSPVNLTGPQPEVVLSGLTKAIAGGQNIPVTLHFQHAGSVTVELPVQPQSFYYSTFSPPASPTVTTAPTGTATPSAPGTASPTATATPTP